MGGDFFLRILLQPVRDGRESLSSFLCFDAETQEFFFGPQPWSLGCFLGGNDGPLSPGSRGMIAIPARQPKRVFRDGQAGDQI